MRVRVVTTTLAFALIPSLAAAQSSPVADALREQAASAGKHLVAAAEEMPADKYSFKPTAAQMTFGEIVAHLVEGNDYLCGTLSGMKAPARGKLAKTSSKEVLVGQLRESFTFCDQALAKLDDSKLEEQLPFFGGRMKSRAAVIIITAVDWADHYSQSAIYLRLNGLLPPTAKKKAA
jgi:hypothetical protein